MSPAIDVVEKAAVNITPSNGYEQQEKKVDLVMITAGFLVGSALELSFNSPLVQAPISSTTLYCLALLILVGFACIVAGSVVSSRCPYLGRALNHAGVFVGVTAFVFAIAMPFPTSLRCGIWAVYTCALFFVIFCNFYWDK